jgi:hypothetical protein
MKPKVHHGGKPEGRHQLVATINEASVAIINDMGCIQWQYPMTKRLAACTQCNSGHFDHVL